MRCSIIDDKKIIYEGEIYQAILPGQDGEFAVLDFHKTFLYRLRYGIAKVMETILKEDTQNFLIKDGLAKFSNNSLLLLLEIRK